MATRAKALSGGPAYVQETADAWQVIDRASGDVLGSYELWRKALASLLELNAFARAVRESVFHDDNGNASGVWRWLDASAEEPEPGPDGSQVTAGAIRTMIDRLNGGSQPVMVDGGTHDSGAHESTQETSVRANGWGHVGAEWRDLSGRVHLALYCELHPDIAPDVTSGRLAFGSIAFSQSTENKDDAALWSHALTNLPAVQGLMPSSANRSTAGHVFARALPTRLNIMTTKKTAARTDVAPTAATEATPPAADPQPSERADEMPPEQEQAVMADVMSVLRGIFGQADAEPAALVDLLKASADAIKGAIGKAGQPESGTPADSAEKPADEKKDDEAAAKAQNIGLSASVRTLTERMTAAEERSTKLEAEIERRDLRDTIKAKFLTANITLADAELDELTGLAQRSKGDDRTRVIDMALKAANVPPSGRAVTPPKTGEGVTETLKAEAKGTVDEAAILAKAQAEVDKEHPEWPRTKRYAEAFNRSRAALAAAHKAAN